MIIWRNYIKILNNLGCIVRAKMETCKSSSTDDDEVYI